MSDGPRATFSDEMVQRAADALAREAGGEDPFGFEPIRYRESARKALRAAFEGVPMTNYAVGTALQFFDVVICVKDLETRAAAGVYRNNGIEGSFDVVPHTISVSWGHTPRFIKRVDISDMKAPEAAAAA